MTADFTRGIFALLCLLCVIAITTGAWLEMARTQRGDSLLAPRHFRLRLFSAVIWIIALLSLAGTVTIWWPEANATYNQKLQFLAVMNGVLCLIGLGLLLLGVDMWMLSRARRKVEREQAIRFSEQLRELAEKETTRLRDGQSQPTRQSKKVRVYAPKGSPGNQDSSENAPFKSDNLDQSSRNGVFDSSD
jgi:hypothetical protein